MTAISNVSSSAPYVDPGSPDGASGASATLLPPPPGLAGGDIGCDLAVLEVQSGQAQRTLANEDRNAEEIFAQDEAQQEVQALRSEAGSMRDQAWMDGAIALGQAAAGGKSSAIGAVLAGAKGLGDGLHGADQKGDEANAKGFEAAATGAQNGVDGARDAASDAEQLIQSALDFYKEYVATAGQTANTAAGRG